MEWPTTRPGTGSQLTPGSRLLSLAAHHQMSQLPGAYLNGAAGPGTHRGLCAVSARAGTVPASIPVRNAWERAAGHLLVLGNRVLSGVSAELPLDALKPMHCWGSVQ